MVTEEQMIDQMIIAESKEDFDESARILGEIAKVYGFECVLTDDENWILARGKAKIEVMFDSSRGGDIPIDFEADGKTETKLEDPDKVRKIVQMCIKFMKEHTTGPLRQFFVGIHYYGTNPPSNPYSGRVFDETKALEEVRKLLIMIESGDDEIVVQRRE